MRHFRSGLRHFDITEQQWRVLRALSSISEIEVTRLAGATFLLAPSLSRILKDLENRGLIVKRISDEDQRFGLVSLTSEGRSFIEAVGASSERIYQELSGRLGEERLAELMLLLRETERLLGEGDLIQFEPGDGKPRRR